MGYFLRRSGRSLVILVKVAGFAVIATYGVVSMPALAIDDKVPASGDIEAFLHTRKGRH